MILKTIKKMISLSLSSKISRQISYHKASGYDFRKEILCVVSEDYSGAYISACLKSSHPEAGGCSCSQQIWFFKLNVDSIEEGFNALTIEVSKAISKYPKLVFFRWLRLLEDDSLDYVKNYENLSMSEKTNMILRGNEFKAENVVEVYEKYSSGSWFVSSEIPWQSSYGFENPLEYW